MPPVVTRSPKLALYAAFAVTSFLAALVLGRPELAALGAPFALVLVVGLALPPPPRVTAFLRPARRRAVEGEEIDAELVISSPMRAHDLQLALLLPDGIRAPGGAGSLLLSSRDLAGLRVLDSLITGNTVVRVYPRPQQLRSLVAPAETQPFAGNRVARTKGDGIEFADIRPYLHGER